MIFIQTDSVSNFELVTSECVCPGDTETFECNVMGEGTTIFP